MSGPPIGVFSLFRLPLGHFQPHDVLYVFERESHIAGLLRVERESSRDEWTVVELDAVGGLDAGDVRFRLVQHLLRDGAKRGAARFHVACADADDNVELFMQAGFVALRRGARAVPRRRAGRCPAPMDGRGGARRGIRPTSAASTPSRWRGSTRASTPAPVQRLEAFRLPDWERQGRDWRVPRSSLAPILRFADVEAFVQAGAGRRQGRHAARRVRPGRASRRRTSRTTSRLLARPEADVAPLLRYRARRHRGADADDRSRATTTGCSPPSAPTNRRSTGGWRRRASTPIAIVTLLMKETLVRVAEPRLVPAGVR